MRLDGRDGPFLELLTVLLEHLMAGGGLLARRQAHETHDSGVRLASEGVRAALLDDRPNGVRQVGRRLAHIELGRAGNALPPSSRCD
jgi:hypothetical protein